MDHQQQFRRYVIALALMAGGGLALVGLFNLFIDPYGVFGLNRLGIYSSADRESKPAALAASNYNAFIMGNSKAAMIPASELQGYQFFSATFGGAMPEELYYFADRHIHEAEFVIIMLDFWSFREDPPLRADPFAPPGFQSIIEKLFSTQALDESFKTLRRKVLGEQPSFAPDGSFIAQRWIESKSQPNEILYELELREHERWFADYEPSTERMDYLEQLAQVLRDRQIPVVIVLAPLHQESLQRLAGTPAQMRLPQWKARISEMFPTVIDLIDSPYSASENFFPADPTHFRPEVGVEMINQEVLLAPPETN